MKYKFDEKGNIVVKDNHPVMIDDENGDKEIVFNAIGAADKITTLNGESAGYRRRAQTAEKVVAQVKGIDDVPGFITTANTNAGLVANMDDKNKTDVEAAVGNANKAWQTKFDTEETAHKGTKDLLFDANVRTKFATSEQVKKTVLPPGIAYATFKGNFNMDGTANDKDGNPILSKADPSKPAGFEEALGVLIDTYPEKDAILKGSGQSGSGSGGSGNGDGAGGDGDKSSHELIVAGLEARK